MMKNKEVELLSQKLNLEQTVKELKAKLDVLKYDKGC